MQEIALEVSTPADTEARQALRRLPRASAGCDFACGKRRRPSSGHELFFTLAMIGPASFQFLEWEEIDGSQGKAQNLEAIAAMKSLRAGCSLMLQCGSTALAVFGLTRAM